MNWFPNTDPLKQQSSSGDDRSNQSLQQSFTETYGTGVEPPQSVSPKTKKLMQRIFVIVLLGGLVLGAAVSVGVAIFLNKAGLVGVPNSDAPSPVAPSPDLSR
jgi:hypothetical protein